MSQCKKDIGDLMRRYLLILVLFSILIGFSSRICAQTDSSGRRERPQPPPHRKHPSLKEMVDKINIFKKHKKEDQSADAGKQTPADDNSKQPDPKPAPVPPTPAPPRPKPTPVKPKASVKHTARKKATKPVTDQKKPKTNKPTQPII